MARFDDDTAVEPDGEGRWQGRVSAAWSIGDVPNGGYVQALALAAVSRSLSQPHPLTVTSHFLRPCTVNAGVVIEVEHIRTGRNVATASARMIQEGREQLRMLATYGDLSTASGPTAITGRPPALPPPEECTGRGDAGLFPGRSEEPPSILGQVDVRLDPTWLGPKAKREAKASAYAAWIRFSDGRAPDIHALPLLVDALPPAVFAIIEPVWVPTIELTTHVRGLPAPGWLRAAVSTRFLIDGLFEEECELWDVDDRLVATSRQLARVLTPPADAPSPTPGAEGTSGLAN